MTVPLTQLALGLYIEQQFNEVQMPVRACERTVNLHLFHQTHRNALAAAIWRALSTNPSGTRPESFDAVEAEMSDRVSQYSSHAARPTSAQ